MHIQRSAPITLQRRQRGAILAISLMVLLVLTLIGISSMDGSIMEEKMAANAQISTTTFQEADSAVRQTFYQEELFDSKKRTAAVSKARFASLTDRQRDHSAYGITSKTELAYPVRTDITNPPLYNSSAGTFVAHGIEIVGSAEVDNIGSVSRQGYSIYPMRP